MKFNLDENIPILLKQYILTLGKHDVESVFSENILGFKDKDLLVKVFFKNRILITLDSDFARITLPTNRAFPGILFFHSKRQGKQAIRDLFEEFLRSYSLDQINGKIIIVQSGQIRIRKA